MIYRNHAKDLLEEGLAFFNAGRYYEAHEVWEDLWRVTEGPPKTYYQGLIQAAVGLYHLGHENQTGARAQISKAVGHLSNHPENEHSLDTANLIEQLQEIMKQMQPREVRIARLK